MAAVFGTSAPVVADVVALAEVALGAGLIVGTLLVRRGHRRFHQYLQSAIVLVNLPLVLVWMLPSYLRNVLPGIAEGLSQPYYLLPTVMLVLGAIAEALGVYVILVAGTNLLPERLRFHRYRRWMRTVLALWWAVLLLGLLTYVVWYVPGFAG